MVTIGEGPIRRPSGRRLQVLVRAVGLRHRIDVAGGQRVVLVVLELEGRVLAPLALLVVLAGAEGTRARQARAPGGVEAAGGTPVNVPQRMMAIVRRSGGVSADGTVGVALPADA